MHKKPKQFSRLTNASSEKLESMNVELPVHFAWHNFCHVHPSPRVIPATAAGN
jgi:hypothetical protein